MEILAQEFWKAFRAAPRQYFRPLVIVARWCRQILKCTR